MDSREQHLGECFVIADHQVVDVAAIIAQCVMNEINVSRKLVVTDFARSERAAKGEISTEQFWNRRLIVSVPNVGVETLYEVFRSFSHRRDSRSSQSC